MNAGLFARVPVIASLVVVAVLATATLTLAATSASPTPAPAAPAPAPALEPLIVPDLRNQAYVFAKGALEQDGFAWRVSGSVQGYPANIVASQSPPAGTRVVADGAPIVTLRLSRNPAYEQDGVPENKSPYAGRPVRLPGAKKPATAPARAAASAPKPKPAAPKAAAPKPAAAKPIPVKPVAKPASRKPAFVSPGAPSEPLDEMPLTARAKQLASWVEAHPKPTSAGVQHWLYQHNWIVTGAAFGWSGGAEALRTLIEVDRRVQELWGVGGRSESVARRALAEVGTRSR